MPTLAKFLRFDVTARGASLTCAVWLHSQEYAPGTFSLVRYLVEEHSPRGIPHLFGKSATRQTFDIQIFDCDEAEAVDDCTRRFVLKILAAISRRRVRSLKKLNRFLSAL